MKKGFTLIELLVAATIITVLVSIGIVSYGSINRRSRDTKRKSDIEQIRSALEMYRADNGFYPNPGAGLWTEAAALANNPPTYLIPNYMPSIPTDPKQISDNTYTYYYQATNLSGTNYYGYCLTAYLEAETPAANACVRAGLPTGAQAGYGVRNP